MIEDHENASVWPYIGLFALAYLFLRLAASLFLAMVHAENYRTILIIGVSAGVSAHSYLKDHSRLLSGTEKIKLIAGTFICTLVIDASYLMRDRMIFGEISSVRFVLSELVDLLVLWLVFGPVMKDIYSRRTGQQ